VHFAQGFDRLHLGYSWRSQSGPASLVALGGDPSSIRLGGEERSRWGDPAGGRAGAEAESRSCGGAGGGRGGAGDRAVGQSPRWRGRRGGAGGRAVVRAIARWGGVFVTRWGGRRPRGAGGHAVGRVPPQWGGVGGGVGGAE
jgi:hypothetical protein